MVSFWCMQCMQNLKIEYIIVRIIFSILYLGKFAEN